MSIWSKIMEYEWKLWHLVIWAHPPVDWQDKIDELETRIKVLENKVESHTVFNPDTGEVKYRKPDK